MEKRSSFSSVKFTCMVAVVCAFAATMSGKDLVWTGSVNANWDTSTANWVESGTTTAATFANGDTVTFDDTATRFDCRITTGVKPGSITFNNETDYLLWTTAGGPIQSGSGPTDKYGTGSLFLSNNVSASTSDVHIWKGTVKNCEPNCKNSFGGARKIYVHDGARLWLAARNSSGDVTGGWMDVVVYTNGVIDLNKPAGGVCPVKSLTLDGGTFVSGKGDNTYGTLKIEEGFAVKGTEPYVFTNTLDSSGNAYNGQYIIIGLASETTFNIADITGGAETASEADELADATFYLPFKKVPGWNSPNGYHDLVKSGPGTMKLAVAAQTGTSAPGGRWRIDEGTLDFAQQYSLCHTVTNPVYVGPGAKMRVSERNFMTAVSAATLARPIVVDHGTLELCKSFQKLGPLTFDHASFVYTNAVDFFTGYLGVLEFGTNLTIVADEPVTLTPASNPAPGRVTFHLAPDPYGTDIHIDAISGNTGYDLTIEHVLQNQVSVLYGNASGVITGRTTRASGFIKTGTGSMLLSNKDSTYNGYTEIREGTVVLDLAGYSSKTFGSGNASYLGNMLTAGRQIVVSTNGTLRINQRNIFNTMYAAGVSGMNAELVIRGGTLDCAAGSGSGIGNLTLDGATWNYSSGNSIWGLWQINHTFKLTGTKPYDFPIVGSGIAEHQGITLAPGTATTFDVDDITGDGAVDASFGIRLLQPPANDRTNYVYGLTKDGEGTLRIASTYIINNLLPNGTNDVVAGTLQVDSWDIFRNTKTSIVHDGAYLSGTGRVTNVEILTGGGFAANAARRVPLTVTGNVTLPTSGVVDIYAPEGSDPASGHIDLATVAGTITGSENLSNWTVRVNGTDVPSGSPYRVVLVGNTLRVGYYAGTCLILR